MNQQLYASLSTQTKQQFSVEKFKNLFRKRLSECKPDEKNNKKIVTMTFSKPILKSQGPCNKVEESAFSFKDVKLLNFYMSKICNHDVSLVSNEKYEWDSHKHPEIALNLVKTCDVPPELEDNEKEIYFFVIEFDPVFPQFKLTASYFEKFENLASLSLCEYYFDDVDIVSMFSKIPFLQFLFLKYCSIVGGRLQKILDTCFNLHTMRLIHCDYDTSGEPIIFPKQMKNVCIRRYESLEIDVSRCEKTLEQLELHTKYYFVKIITSQGSFTDIAKSQGLHLRKLKLRSYLKYPGCFGGSLKFLTELIVDWVAIYDNATIVPSIKKIILLAGNFEERSLNVNLECIMHLDMFCVVRPSSDYDLNCTFSTAPEPGHYINTILKWSRLKIQNLRFQHNSVTLMKNDPRCLIKRSF